MIRIIIFTTSIITVLYTFISNYFELRHNYINLQKSIEVQEKIYESQKIQKQKLESLNKQLEKDFLEIQNNQLTIKDDKELLDKAKCIFKNLENDTKC